MALAAGKVEDVEETEAALLAAHGRKHGGQAPPKRPFGYALAPDTRTDLWWRPKRMSLYFFENEERRGATEAFERHFR